MKKYAVLGWPVEHSLSPQMHNAAFKASSIDALYEKIPCPPEEIGRVVEHLRQQNYQGWNCTVPLKYDIIPLLDSIDEEAAACGSVNTIINNNGKLHGTSTDGYGLLQSLKEELDIEVKGKCVLFIGAGGAGRAVAAAAARAGMRELRIVNRTRSKAESIIAMGHSFNQALIGKVWESAEVRQDNNPASGADIIIQCTSLGLKAEDALPFPVEFIGKNTKVIDMIYGNTPFLQALRKNGIACTDGLGMLLHQGAKAWECWTHQKAPVAVMRQALLQAKKGN